jgi:hypothetical protein
MSDERLIALWRKRPISRQIQTGGHGIERKALSNQARKSPPSLSDPQVVPRRAVALLRPPLF